MKSCNRILALILSVLIMVSSMSVLANAASVSDFYDFPAGSWSEGAMTAAVNNDLLKGRGNGSIAPKDYITRAEAVAVINRAFGATVKADISGYTDVAKNSWYYDEIARAVNMQTLVGVSSNRIDPNGYITRESMLTILARALVLDEGSASSLSKFIDSRDVSKWAEPLVAAMAERGYVNGNEKGELNPKGYITREEFAQVMHNIFRIYIPKTVTIDGTTYGTTIIRAKDVTLNNVTINGDLIAGDGVGDGNLNLTNVTVTGRILFRGGEGNVTLTNTTVGERVIINDVNGVVNFLNYRAEEPFKNIKENTKATFLNLKVNTGGGGSSTPSRAEYKIREYVQNIDGSYPSSAKYTDEKMADYGKTITYNPRTIEGFTFDATHPDSVLSGTNKGKLTLKAYYTRNKYTVSFDGYEVELPYGENISKDNPLKDKMQATIDENEEAGYNTEFNTKEDGTGKEVTIDDTTVGAEDLPIYAIKTPIEYKINYNLNGGKIEGAYDKTYNVEKEIILPVNVVKSGYTFGGWTDENGAPVTKIDVGTKGNKTFNANWNIITYTITYVAGENGTMDGVTAKTTYTVEDGKYTLPEPVVTKQDYIFKGWYTNANFTGRPVTVLNPQDAEDKTYYARIEERTYEQYTIKFDGKTYTVTEGEKIGDAVDRNGNKLSEAMDNVTYPKGYEADDFRIKGDDTTVITKDTIATGDMEIVAAKKLVKYTISFVLNDGSFVNVIPKTEYTVEDADYTLPVPEKTDYNFLGWYEKADFSDTEVKVLDTADAENKIYYANWKKITYTIIFNGTQYTVEKDAKISEATDANGNKLGTAMDNVTYPTGYEADGFHIKGDTSAKVTKDTSATGNMEIVAAKKAIVYTITYVLGGGSLDGTQKTSYTVEDADYTLPKPTKAGSTFLGWYENGTKVTKLDTADAENKTYTAKWSEPVADIYTITFDGKEYDVTEDKELSTNDELKAAMEDALVKPGYDVSFNTKPDGTGEDIDISYVPEGDMTIYIIEVAKEYTITYEENGGDNIVDDTYTIEDADITLPVPTRDGYVFRGWYEEADFSGTVVTVLDTADLENKTYYAKWVLDNAVLSFDHEVNGDVVTLKVMLNAIPADIDDIAAMSIRYGFDNTKLEYVSTTSNVGEVTAASAGYISWYTTSNYITADTLTAKDNILFTITFNVKDGQYGTTTISYTSAEITASEPVGNPQVAEKYTKESETIDLGTQVQTYTITYVENGGVEIPDGYYTANDADITLPIPTRADYAFKGWYENADFIGAPVKVLDTADAEDKTYYAKWVIEKATLGFSSEIIGNTVKIYVTLDEIPSDIDEISAFTLKYKHPDNKLTYVGGTTTFGGQFSTQDGYISWYNENNEITSEALKANGNIIATLEFLKTDSASGIETFEYTTVEIVASEPVINPAIATKYVTEKKEVQLDAATYVVTFKGQTYNITAGNPLSSNALLVAAMNEAANKSGYTVTFNTKANGTGENVTTAYVPTGTMEVYVVEDAIDYSITYELDGGALDGTQKTSYTVEDADYTLPTPTKDNYNFLGWYEGSTKVTILDTADAENKTYIAKWEEITIPETEYTITYELGGIGELPAGAKTKYKTSELPYTLPVLEDTATHTFEGWEDENGNPVTEIVAGTTGNLVFTATWEEITIPETEYTITYELGGIGELPAGAKTTYKTSELPYTLPVLEHTTTHTFKGWKDVNGNLVAEIVAGTTGNLEFTAIWEEIPEDAYTITYVTNGGTLDGTQKTSYTASQLPYTLPVPQKDEVPFVGWYEDEACTGEAVTEITAGSTGNKTYYAKWQEYTLQFYLGTKRTLNKPTSYDGDKGQMIVEHGATLTQSDVDRELGMLPSEYKVREGYVDSDGVVHKIVPELWYQKNSEWTKFVPEEVEVISDMDIHLFVRVVALQYNTDLKIKGIDMSKLDFSIAVPYDSYTDIGKTYLDFLTNAGITMERVIDQVEAQGYDLYQLAIDKAASKNLVDSDGNIMNPNVPVPLHRFITKERILAEIDKYIENNLDNEEFIADILRNDVVVNMLLDDDSIRIKVMEDDSKREQFITDSFIDEMLGDEDLVKKIVTSDEFKKRFIYNDSTLEYVLDDEELMDMIINDPEFHKILIDECVKYVIDVYFEETKESPALYNYIEEVLHSDEFIKDIESKPELKDILEDEIKELVKSSDKDTRKEVYDAIRDKNNTTIRKTIIDVIKNDTVIKDDIKAVVQEDTVLQADIKAAVKDSAKGEIKDSVKTWILNKIDADDEIEASFTNYIKSDKETLKLVLADITDVDNSYIDDYINGTLDPVLAADIDSKIDNYLADEANLKFSIGVYFDTFYANSYDDMYDDYFDDFYNDDEIFNVAYDKFVEDEDSFESVFDSFVENDDNMDKAFNTFMNNAAEFDAFYQQFVADKEQFNTLFERYYKTHVHDVAKKAYENPDLHDMVQNYIWTYTEELVVEYADGTLEAKHPELVDAIDELMHDDVPLALRNAYENNPTVKSKIDNLIETDAIDIIEKYRNGSLDAGTQNFLDGEISSYIDDVIDDYIDGTIDSDMKEFVDNEIDEYMEKLINDYISGTDRDTLGDLIPTYAQDAVDAIKETEAFKNTIDDFVSGNGVRVNEENLMFVEIIADIIGKYDYEKLTTDFLPEKVKKVLDLVGRDTAEEYVNKYLDVFCAGINEALDNLNADLDAGIEGTEYKFTTSPATRINYMEVIDNYYTTLSGKLRDKINSQSKIPVSSNPYAQRIVDMDYFALVFDRTGEETEQKSGYKLKDDVMEYYNNMLELQILLHDAVTFYGSMDTYTIEDRLDSASILIGTYANKANKVVMNFIENGELPKGYTLEDILALDTRIENIYNKFEDKIQKGEDLYAEYLDRDYTDIIDLANMSIYSGGDAYKIYQIILENGEDAFDFDDAVTAVFDSPNYHGVSKIEDAMAKVEAKIKDYAYDPEAEANTTEKTHMAFVDGYKGTFESREIKGYETGNHTVALQRYLRYYK